MKKRMNSYMEKNKIIKQISQEKDENVIMT